MTKNEQLAKRITMASKWNGLDNVNDSEQVVRDRDSIRERYRVLRKNCDSFTEAEERAFQEFVELLLDAEQFSE